MGRWLRQGVDGNTVGVEKSMVGRETEDTNQDPQGGDLWKTWRRDLSTDSWSADGDSESWIESSLSSASQFWEKSWTHHCPCSRLSPLRKMCPSCSYASLHPQTFICSSGFHAVARCRYKAPLVLVTGSNAEEGIGYPCRCSEKSWQVPR